MAARRGGGSGILPHRDIVSLLSHLWALSKNPGELGVSHIGECAQRWGVRKAHPLGDTGLWTEGRFLSCGA